MLSQDLHDKLYKLRTSICASNSIVILLMGITDLFLISGLIISLLDCWYVLLRQHLLQIQLYLYPK